MAAEIQFLLYNMPDEEGKVQVVIKDETIWCTQKAMAQLFGVGVPAISKHLKNIFEEGELQMDSVISKMETTATDNKNYSTTFYSLDAIISVGYRVNSMKATRFRQWATKILNEYIRKGFVLDDDRLKQGTAVFGKDYFRELLERIRLSGQANGAFGNKLRISMPNAVPTMTAILPQQKSFTPRCKTAFIMPLPDKRLLKSSTQKQTTRKNTWDLQHGKILPMGEYSNRMYP